MSHVQIYWNLELELKIIASYFSAGDLSCMHQKSTSARNGFLQNSSSVLHGAAGALLKTMNVRSANK